MVLSPHSLLLRWVRAQEGTVTTAASHAALLTRHSGFTAHGGPGGLSSPHRAQRRHQFREGFLAEVIDEPRLKGQVGESQVKRRERTFFAGEQRGRQHTGPTSWVWGGGAALPVGNGGQRVSLAVALKGCDGWRKGRD